MGQESVALISVVTKSAKFAMSRYNINKDEAEHETEPLSGWEGRRRR